MFISLPSTCIQNFSNWLGLFDFFIAFCSRCGMKWDTACRPTDDPFWAFLSPGAQEPVHPQTLFVYFRQLKKYILGPSKKDNNPSLLPQQGFWILLYKFETSWALLSRVSRGFFAISGASNFKHFKQLFMTLLFGLLTMWDWASLSSLLFCI